MPAIRDYRIMDCNDLQIRRAYRKHFLVTSYLMSIQDAKAKLVEDMGHSRARKFIESTASSSETREPM